jgi:hypothetical protein
MKRIQSKPVKPKQEYTFRKKNRQVSQRYC